MSDHKSHFKALLLAFQIYVPNHFRNLMDAAQNSSRPAFLQTALPDLAATRPLTQTRSSFPVSTRRNL